MKAGDWNRIEVGVPEEGQLCVVKTKHGYYEVVKFEVGPVGGFWGAGRYFSSESVTHWLPIVEPKID
jgi:hypothetical protein